MTRVLFTATQLPDPPHSGGSQRTRLCFDLLRSLGSVDAAFLLPAPPASHQLDFLHHHCHRVFIFTKSQLQQARPAARLHRFLPRPIARDLSFFFDADRYRWLPNPTARDALGDLHAYDFIVARYLQSAATFDLFQHPRLFLDVDDFDPDRLRSRLPTVNPIKRCALRRCLRFSTKAHRTLLPRAHQLWVTNPDDRHHPELARANVLPNIPFPENFPANHLTIPPASKADPSLLMVGTFTYSANRTGLCHFLRTAWPIIRREHSAATLHIVGHGSDTCLRHLPAGVLTHGSVDSLQPFYTDARAVIAPLLSGAGTNIKVLEAAAYARSCVASPIALRGLSPPFHHNRNCLRADSPQTFATHCLDLLHQPDRATTLGQAARDTVQQHFSRDAFAAAFLGRLTSPFL